jgi:hypothetical protein
MQLEITQGSQAITNLDWFCTDEAEHVGYFSTEAQELPPSVKAATAELTTVARYLWEKLKYVSDFRVDPRLALEIPDRHDRDELYLRNFTPLAAKGIFPFDSARYPQTYYFRVAIPTRPLHLYDLPDNIAKIIARTKLRGSLLRTITRLEYEESLTI